LVMVEIEESLLDMLRCMRAFIIEMSEALKSFSKKSGNPLGMHAELASNRLDLVARDLEVGLRYAGVKPDLGSLEKAEDLCGSFLRDVFENLKQSLNKLSSEDPADLEKILGSFDDALTLAASSLPSIGKLFEELEDPHLKFLGKIVKNSADDFEIIKRRHRELSSLTQRP